MKALDRFAEIMKGRPENVWDNIVVEQTPDIRFEDIEILHNKGFVIEIHPRYELHSPTLNMIVIPRYLLTAEGVEYVKFTKL